MQENDAFWDFYWETRLQPMENLGKQAAILAASKLMREIAPKLDHPLRLLEPGCGEGQVIGTLLDAHSSLCDLQSSAGVDYNPQFLEKCRRDYPFLHCVAGDLSDPHLLAGLGKFDVLLLVNTLHEVFSDAFSIEMNAIDIPLARDRVRQALASALNCLEPEGWLLLFDGLESAGDPALLLRIHFHDAAILQEFETFCSQYQPFPITYRQAGDPLTVELTSHDFTRYITKSIFLGKHLWESERLQSYQYFTEEDFRDTLSDLGMKITELRILTVNEEKWKALVSIESAGIRFPDEHILILAQRSAS